MFYKVPQNYFAWTLIILALTEQRQLVHPILN